MSSARAFMTVLALYAAGLGAAGQFAKLSVPFDQLEAIYPDAGAGFAVSLVSVMGVVLGLFVGLLVARLGFRRMLLWALVAGAAVAPLQALFPPLPVFLGLRLAEGIPHLIITVAAPTLMAELTPERWKGAVMTVWSTFFGVTFAIVALLPGSIFGLILGHGAWLLAMAGILWVLLPEVPVRRNLPRLTIGRILADHATCYSSARLAAPALGWLCYTLTYVSVLTVLPTQLAPDEAEWVTPILPIAGLAVSLTFGILLLRFVSPVVLVVTGFASAAALALILLARPDPWLVIALMSLLGLVQSGSFAAVPYLNPDMTDQAQANGAMGQMGNLGNALGTPLLLVLISMGGGSAVFAGLAAAYVVGAGLHLTLALQRRRQKTACSPRSASARPSITASR